MAKGGRPKAKNKMSERLNANATETEVSDFNDACAKMKLERTYVLRALAEAFVNYTKENDSVTFPLRLSPPK